MKTIRELLDKNIHIVITMFILIAMVSLFCIGYKSGSNHTKVELDRIYQEGYDKGYEDAFLDGVQ
jgi:hypothetical protein